MLGDDRRWIETVAIGPSPPDHRGVSLRRLRGSTSSGPCLKFASYSRTLGHPVGRGPCARVPGGCRGADRTTPDRVLCAQALAAIRTHARELDLGSTHGQWRGGARPRRRPPWIESPHERRDPPHHLPRLDLPPAWKAYGAVWVGHHHTTRGSTGARPGPGQQTGEGQHRCEAIPVR